MIINKAQWAVDWLHLVGNPNPSDTLKLFVHAWEIRESGWADKSPSAFNPLNTEHHMLGSTDYNPAGVQNFLTYQDGLQANRDALYDGNYPTLSYVLKNNLDTMLTGHDPFMMGDLSMWVKGNRADSQYADSIFAVMEKLGATSMTDYLNAESHLLDPARFGFDVNHHLAIVIHKTGGDATPQAVENTFLATGRSVHYVVGQDGTIWQFIPEARGAGGNCCPDDSHQPVWDPIIAACTVNGKVNLNFGTISIEHCDPASDNSTPLTQIQAIQSFRLIHYLMGKYNIDYEHVLPHKSINRTACPGNYPWTGLAQYLYNAAHPKPPVPPVPPVPPAGDLLTLAAKIQSDLNDLVAALQKS